MTERKRILITGGSGLLGSAVVDRLRHLRPVCLTRRSPVDPVTDVAVNLGEERLGLSQADYRRLADRTEVVVHCAALTGFQVSLADAMAVNRDGTRNLLRLAEHAGARFVYVSSAFVARRHHAPAARPDGQPSPWNYLDSKQAAEDLVHDSDVASVVVRPSIIIGDSLTGRIRRPQGFHTMLEASCKGLLPVIPFDADSGIDFIPQDIVAREIADLTLDPAAVGERWHTAGPEVVSALEIARTCQNVMRDSGRDVRMPQFMRPDVVNRLILPAFAPALPARLLVKFLGLVAMGQLFGPDREYFPTSLPPGQPLREALETNIRHRWGTPAPDRVYEGAA
jgi:nucleoside-diphosphate-sugar epimerase